MDLRKTLNLPDSDATIPMKANLPSLEPAIQKIWADQAIYHRIQEARKDAPVFVLHDGPPYTNSPIHIGTALNKILKDFVVKSRSMMGYWAPYVPGFDTHGLPIEMAVTKKLAEKKITATGSELRQACRAHVAEFIAVQSAQFQRLGVFGLWERPYATLDYAFEAEIVRTFGHLAEKELTYRGLRPTQWSPTLRTALADTEIVYQEGHISKAIYVTFEMDKDGSFDRYFESIAAIIWTTTPWTIPANLALAFSPELNYVLVSVPGHDRLYLLAEPLVEKVAAKLGWEDWSIVNKAQGEAFEGMTFRHPVFGRPSVGVLADYVTAEDGTGIVHTAPSHGRDDFYTGQKYGLGVPNTVDERGVLTEETGEFAGTFYKTCDTVVVDRLRELDALLLVEDFVHSYPHAERDGQPIIFRATEQWFVAIDPLRQKMNEEIREVRWFPETGENRISAMVKNRPDWCVSRQRHWGVGIPVFYGLPSRTPVLDPVAIEAVAQLVEREGSDGWFEKTPAEILPEGYVHPETGETEFTKETDTLDVWFDAGSTSLVVLDQQVFPEWKAQRLHWPADVYLEGSDQHRGWFNTSLILGTALKGGAPYKTVVTHGFTTDEQGRKMSKRLGNVVDPVAVCEKFGADVLRVWVASVKWEDDAPCGDNVLKQASEIYRDLRNVLRFLIGAANQSKDGSSHATEPIDIWLLAQLRETRSRVLEAYERYDFGTVLRELHGFSRDTLSRFYLDVLKDRLYCDAPDSPRRLSAEATCRKAAERLIVLMAPIVPHTAEEAWTKLGHGDSVFLETIPTDTGEVSPDLLSVFTKLLAAREAVNAGFEAWKGTEGIKDSQDAIATLPPDLHPDGFSPDDLATHLRVSWVEQGDALGFGRSPYLKCARSRVRRPDVEEVELDGEAVPLSARDRAVLGV
ncbi:isoleucine--tRNA ligase [soil metagenome]